MALPVVSPTTVLLGIVSTLFSLGEAQMAREFLDLVHWCRVAVDPPEGVVFFRAFHQLRRYETNKYLSSKGQNPRMGLTQPGQGTREYGLLDGDMTLYVGAPRSVIGCVQLALRNRDHLGTRDSLCSLVGEVESCAEPENVVYSPPESWQRKIPDASAVTVLTLSRFRTSEQIRPAVGEHWWMAGGVETNLAPYLIKGRFTGTGGGKIYVKNPANP
jgi:hypothetical protein